MALESVRKSSLFVQLQTLYSCVKQSPRPAIYLISSIGLLFFALISSAHAAIVLNYMEISIERENAIIEWSTASEHELLGFELYYKKEAESQSQYNKIGEQVAQGSVTSGAVYRIALTDSLQPDTTYCFRLVEVTLNNDRGEIIDRCGYGIAITPTSSVTSTDSTVETVQPTATITLATTVEEPIIVTATPVATTDNTLSPLPTTETMPTPPILPTPPSGMDSPLATPAMTAEENTTATDDGIIGSSAVDSTGENSVVQNVAGQTTSVLPTNVADDVNASYIVLTVTPTSALLANNPTFTPFPTALPVQTDNRLFAILPNTQNLMIVLLCGVFSGASGLGILGLVTTLLYMRSRSK